MKLNGIEFFPFPTSNSTALQLIEAKFDFQGFAIYVKLMQKIFNEEGYYFAINDDVILLLNKEFRLSNNLLLDVIDECVKRDLFDKSMYEKYKILTSNEIQKDYLHAVQRRKNIDIKEEYRLKSVKDYFSKDNTNQEMYAKTQKMYTKTQKMYTESEKKDTKTNIVYNSIEENRIEENGEEKEIKEKEQVADFSSQDLNSPLNKKDYSAREQSFPPNDLDKQIFNSLRLQSNEHCEQGRFINEEEVSFNEQLNQELKGKFKEMTNKYVDDVEFIPDNIDIDLLIEKVNNSTFLKNAPNFTLKHCLKYYDKIIAGFYDNDNNDARKALFGNNNSNQNYSNNYGYQNNYTKPTYERKYTKEELDSLFTNIDDIKF